MSTLIQINVTNKSPFMENIFFFQQPAIYSGGPTVYSNSLLSTPLLPHSQGGSSTTFLLELQYYAGAQQRFQPPTVGKPSGYSSAIEPIELTPANGASVNNSTSMIVAPALGLAPPVNVQGVEVGAFRIITPAFNSTVTPYNIGSAVTTPSGSVILSSFQTAHPSSNLDCQPVLQFYVAAGDYSAGTVMNFSTSSVGAALCDATNGFTTFNVTYNADGTWTVVPSVSSLKSTLNAKGRRSVEPVALNADIRNEAGTATICRGHAANFNVPVVINHLTMPGVLHVLREYQVGPTNGPFQGRMLSAMGPTNAATFD